jgi:L-lactate dehydrogenase complex protein LldF
MSTITNEFHRAADHVTADAEHRAFLRKALGGYEKTRANVQARFTDWSVARDAAAAIKWAALEDMHALIQRFVDNLERRGVKVCWAEDAEQARAYIIDVVRRRQAKTIVKSKCMTSEEIHLNHALEAEGFGVVESDLGEYIVQLRGEAPYHFVFPSMHLTRKQIDQLFVERHGCPSNDDPEALTMEARRVLRRTYLEADIGFSGANFGIAETGMISITENEGNARLTTALPKVHIALMGIEKIIPSLDDLALLLPMLGTAGAAQALTCYNSQYSGPRRDDEPDGPEEFHVVLLDNQRTRLLADPEQRDALRCIRCGACLNVCPIFKNIGGHSYGTTYQGPIGAVITPHLRGLKDWKHLSSASSLCGACTATCPVRIDLHHHLLRNRRNAAATNPSWHERIAFDVFAAVMRRPWAYRLLTSAGRFAFWLGRPLAGTRIDPLGGWRRTRTLPAPANRSFKDRWRERKAGKGGTP